jgi:transposase
MRFVPLKTEDQLDIQALHRVRNRFVARRTAVINQLRAFLLERGLTVRTGRSHFTRELPRVLEDAENALTVRMLRILAGLRDEWRAIEQAIREVTHELELIARSDMTCQRLVDVPGIGPLGATAIVASIGKGTTFRKGRDFAAWLGLVPRQHSTGGKPMLLGISKKGPSDLRRYLIHGARSLYRLADRSKLALSGWLRALDARANPNVVVVALANKIARIVGLC